MDKKNKNIAISIMSIIPIKILIHFFFFSETYAKSISSSRRGSRRGNNNDVFQYMDENLGYYISNVFSEKLWIFLFIIILFFIAVWYFNYTKDVKIFFNFVIKNFNILRNKIDVNNNNITKNVVKNNTKTNNPEAKKSSVKTVKKETPAADISIEKGEGEGNGGSDDLKQGEMKEYYESGELQFTVNFIDGWKQGEMKEYYESGELQSTVNFEDDLRQGEEKIYMKSGDVQFTRNYVDDVDVDD